MSTPLTFEDAKNALIRRHATLNAQLVTILRDDNYTNEESPDMKSLRKRMLETERDIFTLKQCMRDARVAIENEKGL